MTVRKSGIGNRIAPPRFLLFVGLLIVGLIVAIPALGWGRGVMAAFDGAALVFLGSILPMLRNGEAKRMRQQAARNDANRLVLLGVAGITTLAILVAVAKELQGKDDTLAIALVIASLILAWLFSNTIYALHYAHLFYSDCDGDGKDSGGLDFPNCPEPDYWDFIYFSFTLGMTFQTSDVEISSRRIRMISLGQCLAAFVFNLGILAFTINTLGG